MLKEMSRTRLVGFWFAAVAAIIVWMVAADVTIAFSSVMFLLTMCLVPPAIMLLLWRGAPPPTVGELLYSVNTLKEGRSGSLLAHSPIGALSRSQPR